MAENTIVTADITYNVQTAFIVRAQAATKLLQLRILVRTGAGYFLTQTEQQKESFLKTQELN